MKEKIQAAINAVPELHYYGIGAPREHKDIVVADEQIYLLQSGEEFRKACNWITDNLTPIKNVNKNYSSYSLKLVAQKEIGYIGNGVFIAAMHECEFTVYPKKYNAMFNVSTRSVKAARKRHK
jgi:hypothetical protein